MMLIFQISYVIIIVTAFEVADMENIINRIIEIDRQAQSIVREAALKKEEAPGRIEAGVSALREKYERSLAGHIEKFAETEGAEASERIEKLKREHAACTEALRKAADEHIGEWADIIFKRVVGAGE